ncbi:Aldehyde/histidinol dehydrogenase [Mycena rebaudengoi]|nr:Aldehyde/histidinol dehydrogenase [Mycena rebaudengoi]
MSYVAYYSDQNTYCVILGGVTKVLKLQCARFLMISAIYTYTYVQCRLAYLGTIFYTGNGRIARIVATAAARHLTPLTLELGGKSPVIVDPAYDIALAAKRIPWGKSQNCGQLCVAPDYVLIPRTHRDAFIEALKALYNKFFPEGSLKSSSMSNIINPHHHARVMDFLKRTTTIRPWKTSLTIPCPPTVFHCLFMSSPPSSQANPPICSCPYGTMGIFVYDNDESCSKDHLGVAHAAYYTTNLNQAMLTILRKSDELEFFFDDCEFVSATKHRL